MADALDLMDLGTVECLNQNPSKPWDNVLKQGYREDDGLHCETDCDEQLLLTVPFKQMVKLQGIVFKGSEAANAPKLVKLFVNRTSLGFDEAVSEPAAESFELSEEQVAEGALLPLKLAKFNNVRSLTIFVENNQGDEDVTILSKIQVFGSGIDTTNMAEFKKC
mmetsp:Transcript_23136/g.78786  ORF Transcript_23136/g.78786 Transcript_23136/m.78786 type:complete len:164 (+) Transcript_23136:171-662(+)